MLSKEKKKETLSFHDTKCRRVKFKNDCRAFWRALPPQPEMVVSRRLSTRSPDRNRFIGDVTYERSYII